MNRDAKIVFLMVSLLLMIGVVMIYSSSAVYAMNKYGDSLFFVKKTFYLPVHRTYLVGIFYVYSFRISER